MLNRSYIKGHEGHPHYLSNSKFLSLKKNILLSGKDAELAKVIRNLSDPTKLKIYLLLNRVEEMSVTDLSIILKISQSAVSHALADLKSLGLIESRRCGQLICYAITSQQKDTFLKFIKKFKLVWI